MKIYLRNSCENKQIESIQLNISFKADDKKKSERNNRAITACICTSKSHIIFYFTPNWASATNNKEIAWGPPVSQTYNPNQSNISAVK